MPVTAATPTLDSLFVPVVPLDPLRYSRFSHLAHFTDADTCKEQQSLVLATISMVLTHYQSLRAALVASVQLMSHQGWRPS